MEHHLLQLQPLSPQDHLMVSSAFFNAHFACGGGGGGFAAPVALQFHDSAGWAAGDLGGGELFGGSADAGTVGDRQPWHSYDDPPPAACVSLDGAGGGSPPSWEQGVRELAGEPNGDGSNCVAGSRKRRDRSKTIATERKRRVRMKEKLYELRSLVPNITKMDKASIIADAVEYVKKLQSHARKLKEEVATLEARPKSPGRERQDDGGGAGSRAPSRRAGHVGARVAHVGAARVGEGRFLVTVECERRDGAAAHLCAAVESLACFRVEASSLVRRAAPDRVVATVTLKATDQMEGARIGEGTVKLLVMAALGDEGFRPEVPDRIF